MPMSAEECRAHAETCERLETLMVLVRRPVKRQRLVDVLFDPAGQLGVFSWPFGEPSGQIATRFGEIAPVVQPAQLPTPHRFGGHGV
jgi:hypothetical protein